jgi:hypothetical protein
MLRVDFFRQTGVPEGQAVCPIHIPDRVPALERAAHCIHKHFKNGLPLKPAYLLTAFITMWFHNLVTCKMTRVPWICAGTRSCDTPRGARDDVSL